MESVDALTIPVLVSGQVKRGVGSDLAPFVQGHLQLISYQFIRIKINLHDILLIFFKKEFNRQ